MSKVSKQGQLSSPQRSPGHNQRFSLKCHSQSPSAGLPSAIVRAQVPVYQVPKSEPAQVPVYQKWHSQSPSAGLPSAGLPQVPSQARSISKFFFHIHFVLMLENYSQSTKLLDQKTENKNRHDSIFQ